MTPRSELQDTRGIFEFGKQALAEGLSVDEIQYELVTRHEISSYLRQRALPLIAAYATAITLSRMTYRSWILRLSNDLLSAGAAGLWLAAFMIPVGLVASHWVVTSWGLTDGTSSGALAPMVAALCLPFAWVAGWPIFLLSRTYWRWKVRRLDAIRDLESIDTSRLPRWNFFE